MCSLNFLDTPAIDDGLVMAFKHAGIVCPSRYNSSSFSFYRCFKRRCKISRWSVAFNFWKGFVVGINIKYLQGNALQWGIMNPTVQHPGCFLNILFPHSNLLVKEKVFYTKIQIYHILFLWCDWRYRDLLAAENIPLSVTVLCFYHSYHLHRYFRSYLAICLSCYVWFQVNLFQIHSYAALTFGMFV